MYLFFTIQKKTIQCHRVCLRKIIAEMTFFDISSLFLSGVCENPAWALWLLLARSFLAATLLPGGSEVVLFAVIRCHPDWLWPVLLVATVGNTAGGLTSYGVGRFFRPPVSFRYLDQVQRYGAFSLILSWTPLIGDLLCVTAGWLRISWISSTFWMAIGKFARYALVVMVASAV